MPSILGNDNLQLILLSIFQVHLTGKVYVSETTRIPIRPTMRSETRKRAFGIELPHIKVISILLCKTDASRCSFYRELCLDCIIFHGICSSSIAVRCLNPFCLSPSGCQKSCIEIASLSRSGLMSFIITYSNMPIISCRWFEDDTLCRNMNRLVRLNYPTVPYFLPSIFI